MLERLTKAEAAKYIGCCLSKLNQMEKAGLMKGTYYEIGNGQIRRKIYIVERLDEWLLQGGEPAAWERKAIEQGRLRLVPKNEAAI